MPPSPFPKVPIEYAPDPRWPWKPIYLTEAVPGPSRLVHTAEPNSEGGHSEIAVDFVTMGMRKERIGLRRWWRWLRSGRPGT